MNFKCHLSELNAAYKLLSQLASASSDPIHKLLRLTLTTGNRLIIDTCNGMSTALVALDAVEGTPGSLCVDSTIFQKSIRKGSSAFRMYEFTEDGTGSANTRLLENSSGTITERENAFQIKDAAIFTKFEHTNPAANNPSMQVNAQALRSALSIGECVMDSSITNETYQAIAFELSAADSCLRVITTNGTQMSKTEVAAVSSSSINDSVSFNLSSNDSDVLFQALSACNDEMNVTIDVYPEYIRTYFEPLKAKFYTKRLNMPVMDWRPIMAFSGIGIRSFTTKISTLRDMTDGVIADTKAGVQQLTLFVEGNSLVSRSGNMVSSETIRTLTDSSSAEGFSVVLDATKVQKTLQGFAKEAELTFTQCDNYRLYITASPDTPIKGLSDFAQMWSTLVV